MGEGPRIVYQSFGPEDNRGYLDALRATVTAAAAAHGAQIEVRALEGAVLAQKQHRAFHLAAGAALLDAIHAAEAGGAQAAVIGNIQDPALYECRQVCAIPVVGLLETALAGTRPFGANVALVSTSRRTHALLRERALVYGEERRVHSITSADLPLTDIARAFTDDGIARACLERFRNVAAAAVAAGAEIVVPASGILATLLAARHGHAAAWDLTLGAPVVDPVWLAVAAAASGARLQKAGLFVSRAGTYDAPAKADAERYFAARSRTTS